MKRYKLRDQPGGGCQQPAFKMGMELERLAASLIASCVMTNGQAGMHHDSR